MDNQRNLLLAVALSAVLIIGWDFAMRTFYPEAAFSSPVEEVEPTAQASAGGAPGTTTVAGDLPDGVTPVAGPVDLSAALADPNRVVIETPKLAGSINLVGAQIDDIVLKDYRQSVDKDSGPVRLFAPARTEDQYFAQFGFVAGGERMPSTVVWEASGDKLTPNTPVTLTHTDEAGLTYTIALSIDEDYMISAAQSVANASEAAAIVQPFTIIDRTSKNASPDEFIVHSGPIGVFDDTLQDGNNYEELTEIGRDMPAGTADWLGFTDRYWLSALVPGEGETASAGFRALGGDLFRTGITYQAQTIPAGGSLTQSTRLFAGAKNSIVLDKYEDSGIRSFGNAISWGWFGFIEKPFLWLLRTLNGLVGNFGVAIILLTVIVRGLMFPIAQKGFASMAAMKAIQPKMKAVQERYKDDKQQQQQEIMKLYKQEGVNPLAGCLPILIQIPIFFALYKVLMLAIEMRHEPFLYISDLSAPDPATILNLFGYLPFEVPGFLGIGVLAVLLGVTMWITFKLNPAAMDPMQQQIFNLMPWILMFVMAPFAAGLLLYWVTSNILTVAQQSYLYSKHPALKAQAKKDKEEMAKKKAAEKEAKGKA
ncbi:membrane protein insertase YidC [Erythrobacter sp. F6033]|uniref:membrane protein insertase YidC n=1 Tax=Erythrobacter sp. F6033 TaxID=2926401 RepID=UPI001FF39180|nr:membrane protein insertase YidC [Erythrobacter sp. F6033]MCK0127240.1 membrane protein insertase YidC [Erythrobacter sp. F6033]